MLPLWFNLALDARIHREHLYLLLNADKLGTPEFNNRRHESARLAEDAGYAAPTIPTPPLLNGDEELEEFFRLGQHRWRQEQKEELEDQRNAEIEQRIQSKDWTCLGLPPAVELLADLKNGQGRYIAGHSLSPDKDGVWVTNPYGIDCALWQDIDLEFIESFLADMARGEEYGPVPH